MRLAVLLNAVFHRIEKQVNEFKQSGIITTDLIKNVIKASCIFRNIREFVKMGTKIKKVK